MGKSVLGNAENSYTCLLSAYKYDIFAALFVFKYLI